MTVAEAAITWIEAKRELQRIEPKLKKSAEVLKAYFRKTGKTSYRAKIGYSLSHYKTISPDLVREDLGEEAKKYEVDRQRETLALLKA